MKLKKQFKIFILFIILVNIFAIKETSELSAKLEINTIAIFDAQTFVDLNNKAYSICYEMIGF